ncbi:MAG: type II secretion system protein N [Thiogranum sp.]
MKLWWRSVLLGALAYLLFLFMTAPATKVLPLFQSQLQDIRFTGVEGTLWSGKAVQLDVSPLQLKDVNWSFRPFGLFVGRAVFDIHGQLQAQMLKAKVGSTFLGGRYLSDVRGRVSANDLLSWLGLRQLKLGGMLDFDIDEVEWSESGLPAMAGIASWSPAQLVSPIKLVLGKAELETQIEDAVTRGRLETTGGALLVQADVELKADGAYRFDADIQQKSDVPQAVLKFLSTFAEYKDGSYRLEWADKL